MSYRFNPFTGNFDIAEGEKGDQGEPGSKWLADSGAPGSGDGADGDFYLDTDTGDIYGPKTAGAWGSSIYNIAEGQEGPSASGPITSSGLTMATARLLGRSTASTGAVEEISIGTGLSLSGGTLSGTVVSTSAAGLQPASGYGTITYAAQVTLDFSTRDRQMATVSLTGNLELLTSNLANGQEVRLRLVCDSSQRTLTFPTDWKFVGTKPANIAASKVAVLSLAAFGTTNADVVAAYAVQS